MVIVSFFVASLALLMLITVSILGVLFVRYKYITKSDGAVFT